MYFQKILKGSKILFEKLQVFNTNVKDKIRIIIWNMNRPQTNKLLQDDLIADLITNFIVEKVKKNLCARRVYLNQYI